MLGVRVFMIGVVAGVIGRAAVVLVDGFMGIRSMVLMQGSWFVCSGLCRMDVAM